MILILTDYAAPFLMSTWLLHWAIAVVAMIRLIRLYMLFRHYAAAILLCRYEPRFSATLMLFTTRMPRYFIAMLISTR